MHQPGWKHHEGAAGGRAGAAEPCRQAIFDAHAQRWVVGRGDHSPWVDELQVAADACVLFPPAGIDPVNPGPECTRMAMQGVAVAGLIHVGPGVELPLKRWLSETVLLVVHGGQLVGEFPGKGHQCIAGLPAPLREIVGRLPAAIVAALGAAEVLRHAGADERLQLSIEPLRIGVLKARQGRGEKPADVDEVRIYKRAAGLHGRFARLCQKAQTIRGERLERCNPL